MDSGYQKPKGKRPPRDSEIAQCVSEKNNAFLKPRRNFWNQTMCFWKQNKNSETKNLFLKKRVRVWNQTWPWPRNALQPPGGVGVGGEEGASRRPHGCAVRNLPPPSHSPQAPIRKQAPPCCNGCLYRKPAEHYAIALESVREQWSTTTTHAECTTEADRCWRVHSRNWIETMRFSFMPQAELKMFKNIWKPYFWENSD